MNARLVEKIEAKLTFADGETVDVLLAADADAAWGNVEAVLWRSVPVREALAAAMNDEHLWHDDEDDEESDEDGEDA